MLCKAEGTCVSARRQTEAGSSSRQMSMDEGGDAPHFAQAGPAKSLGLNRLKAEASTGLVWDADWVRIFA